MMKIFDVEQLEKIAGWFPHLQDAILRPVEIVHLRNPDAWAEDLGHNRDAMQAALIEQVKNPKWIMKDAGKTAISLISREGTGESVLDDLTTITMDEAGYVTIPDELIKRSTAHFEELFQAARKSHAYDSTAIVAIILEAKESSNRRSSFCSMEYHFLRSADAWLHEYMRAAGTPSVPVELSGVFMHHAVESIANQPIEDFDFESLIDFLMDQ